MAVTYDVDLFHSEHPPSERPGSDRASGGRGVDQFWRGGRVSFAPAGSLVGTGLDHQQRRLIGQLSLRGDQERNSLTGADSEDEPHGMILSGEVAAGGRWTPDLNRTCGRC